MRIRTSTLFFVITNVVAALMMAGPLAMIFIIGVREFPFIIIPAIFIGLFWSFLLFNYFSTFFLVNEKRFARYALCKKKMDVKFEQVEKITYARDFNNRVIMVNIVFRNDSGNAFTFQLSGSMFNLQRLEQAFAKYGYPVE